MRGGVLKKITRLKYAYAVVVFYKKHIVYSTDFHSLNEQCGVVAAALLSIEHLLGQYFCTIGKLQITRNKLQFN